MRGFTMEKDQLDKKQKYTLADIETSFNYGKIPSIIGLRVIYAGLIFIAICGIILLVSGLAGIFTYNIPKEKWWIFVLVFVFTVIFDIFMLWILLRSRRNVNTIKDSLADAIEVSATVLYEPYIFDCGENALAYVAHFYIDGIEYAITYKTPVNNNNRNDLAFYKNKKCRILYSLKYNDVLILKPKQDEEIL